ncbi:MAG: caspase family protein [Rhodocyclales bacterium]|nr:caspase family protein [Rhodocyclales bacterium]
MRKSFPALRSPERRKALQRLSALSAASLLPLRAGEVFGSTASTLNALPRTALVIGNSRYRDAPLKNPANDAAAIGDNLKKMGFSVIPLLDSGKTAMENAIRSYGEQLAKSKGVGLFYFAGHGLQVNWRNFLVPVDANLDRTDDIPRQTVDLAALLGGIGKAGNPMNIVILDACRDNPFGGDLKSGKGLSQMDAPIGTLLAYATAPGNVASDGSGANGLYTENLLREVRTPEARIEDVFKRVRLAVRRASQGQQIPWESTSLEDDFYFLPPAEIRKLSQGELDRQFAEETAHWEKAQQATQVAVVEDYLRRYPSGRFSELAQVRLDRMLAKRGEKKVSLVNTAANPFTKGTGVIDLDYRVGDRYVFRSIDLLTKVEGRKLIQTVTEVAEDKVIYNNGGPITDLLGNILKTPDGTTYSPRQFFIAEYSLGKKWTTRYAVAFPNGLKDTIEVDLKVVARETITVPAGSFDCYRIEGNGWIFGIGVTIENKFWVAPDKVNRPIASEAWRRQRGRINRSERQELESYTRAG